jgi:hypothetical protein
MLGSAALAGRRAETCMKPEVDFESGSLSSGMHGSGLKEYLHECSSLPFTRSHDWKPTVKMRR